LRAWRSWSTLSEPHKVKRAEPSPQHLLEMWLAMREAERSQGLEHRCRAGSGVDQRGHEHVPGYAADQVEICDASHRLRPRAMSAPIVPAPTPSSTFTTATPGAHEEIIARRAVRPPRLAP
jgi:hypothetical protein